MSSFRFVIVGAGSSSSTPKIDCVAHGRPCAACIDAVRVGPSSRNHRLNPSLLVQVQALPGPVQGPGPGPGQPRVYSVLIDCGKTFREAALKVLCPNNVRSLSAVLLTHHHSDAVMGLDDLREFSLAGPVTVLADERTMASVAACFPYLMPPKEAVAAGPKRWVASIQWQGLANDGSLTDLPLATFGGNPAAEPAATLPFVAFLVPHGGDCLCNAFAFPMTADGRDVLVYMSDVSVVDADVLAAMRRAVATVRRHLRPEGQQVEADDSHVTVLVLDMLSSMEYFAHLNVPQAIAAAVTIAATRTVFVGMGHGLEYTELSVTVRQHNTATASLEVGYDGMEL